MPLCARCSAILTGYALAPVAVGLHWSVPIWIIMLLCAPLMVDGVTQSLKWRESSNLLRVVTGLAFGVGQSLLVSTMAMYAFELYQSLTH